MVGLLLAERWRARNALISLCCCAPTVLEQQQQLGICLSVCMYVCVPVDVSVLEETNLHRTLNMSATRVSYIPLNSFVED